MEIYKSSSCNHLRLTDITKKSKAHWGYSKAQLEEWSDDLTVSESYIESNEVYHLTIDNQIIAYYSYFEEAENVVKLDNMFILPDFIGKGFGKQLMLDFLNRISKTCTKKIVLFSEPNSELFYQKFGFVSVGQLETTIKNRFLPIMELIL